MKKLYFIKNYGYVDLYYNDVYCLQKTVKNIKSLIKKDHNRMIS
jgi:hypothetical protein